MPAEDVDNAALSPATPLASAMHSPTADDQMKVNTKANSKSRTRFAPSRLSSMWRSLVSHLTPPSHPSTTSESALGSSLRNTTDNMYYEDGSAVRHLPLELLNPNAGTDGRHKRRGVSDTKNSGSRGGLRQRLRGSQANSNSRYGDDDDLSAKPSEPVSRIVVDNNFEHFTPAVPKSDSGYGSGRTPATNGTPGGGEIGDDEDEEGTRGLRSDGASTTQRRSSAAAQWIQRNVVVEWVTERFWPNVKHFLDSSYPEPSKEHSFQKEVRVHSILTTVRKLTISQSFGSLKNKVLLLPPYFSSSTTLSPSASCPRPSATSTGLHISVLAVSSLSLSFLLLFLTGLVVIPGYGSLSYSPLAGYLPTSSSSRCISAVSSTMTTNADQGIS